MRLENRTTIRVDVDVLNEDCKTPSAERVGVPEYTAQNVQPCWTKEWNADCVLIVHRYGYTYE